MNERENILADIQERFWGIEGIALVELNPEEMATLEKFPALFLIDVIDEPVKRLNRNEYERQWQIEVFMFVRGTDKDRAPGELATLRTAVKSAIHETSHNIGTLTGGRGFIAETITGPMWFPNMGNYTLAQGIQFDIRYVERNN